MKVRLYFRPTLAIFLLAAAALLFWSGWFMTLSIWRWIFLLAATFYSVLFGLACYALLRCRAIENWIEWIRPERLLILAPHQDDCVICAGGVGLRNAKLGGETFVTYFVQDEVPDIAARRAAEAVHAWSLAGVPASKLRHLDLLPPLYSRRPECLPALLQEIARLIDEVRPTIVIMPMFEGGHIHHDIVNQLALLALANRTSISSLRFPGIWSLFFPQVHAASCHCSMLSLAIRVVLLLRAARRRRRPVDLQG